VREKYLPDYDWSDLNSLKHSRTEEDVPLAVNRILQFASRFCKEKDDNTLYIKFEAENDLPIEDFSFAAAFESMLFGMDPSIVCTGDSAPNLDYNVAQNMNPEVISMKLTAFPLSVVYVKADTSTSSAITLPPEVMNLSEEFADLPENIPTAFGIDNCLALIDLYPAYFPYLMGEGV
jgi:hypothetical protein